MIRRTLLLALSGMGLAIAASAHDGGHLDQWYRSLQAADGTSCCNMRDCAPAEARLKAGVWEVSVEGRWHPVPAAAVLRRENMDGRPIACILGGVVKCFVPPAAS